MNYILLGLIFIILIITAWALLGKGDPGEEGEEPPPEKKYRRRTADQDIERAFPEDGPQKGRRKSDRAPGGPDGESVTETGEDFNLPYGADEIISDSSRFRIYKRTLLNSEVYARKGDYETAISLYQGVSERINDVETNRKIDANIDYLNKYRDFSEKRQKEKEEISKQMMGKKGNEIRVSIDGPLTIPEKIQIGIATPIQHIEKEKQIDIDKIVDEITSKLMSSDFFQRDSETRDRERELKKYINEVGSLREGVNQVLKNDRKLAGGIPAGALDQGGSVITGIQEQLKNMEGRLEDVARESSGARSEIEKIRESARTPQTQRAIRESDRLPSPAEARYSSPIPVTLDTAPIMELLDRLPLKNAPAAAPMKQPYPDKDDEVPGKSQPAAAGRPATAQKPGQGSSPADGQKTAPAKSKEEIDRELRTTEGEGEEEFELFSEYLKDRKEDEENLSDEDIFEKILKEDHEKIQDSFEIRGDNRESGSGFYNLPDDEYERQRTEEERFYEKFLRHEKRVRKELPILKVTYDFSRLPDEFSLSRDKNILEYSLYKYKPLLEKADQFIKKRKVRDAINYYRTVMSQNVPAEFKTMIRKNINDLTEYLEKYLTSE